MRLKTVETFIWYGALFLLAYLPFYVFLSQWLSTITGGLDAWKLSKDILLYAVAVSAFVYLLLRGYWHQRLFRVYTLLFLGYVFLHLIAAVTHLENNIETTVTGMIYNFRIPAACLIGAALVAIKPYKTVVQTTVKTLVVCSAVLAVFGVAQYFLPKDLLTHFGYAIERGTRPMFFIDDKPDLPRVMSFMRDPNTLGAFLLLPFMLVVSKRIPLKRNHAYALLVLLEVCIFLTFSRSAAIGLLLATFSYAAIRNKTLVASYARRFGFVAFLALIVVSGGLYLLRDSYFVQNTILHADESTTLRDSNELRLDFYREAARRIADDPLGYGPGTAGLVSIRDQSSTLLTENYYLQIAYEIGVMGIVLFIFILGYTAWHLWQRFTRGDPLPAVLFATFVALGFINLLLHMWSGEAVAYTWWLFAGMVLFGASGDTRQHSVPQK